MGIGFHLRVKIGVIRQPFAHFDSGILFRTLALSHPGDSTLKFAVPKPGVMEASVAPFVLVNPMGRSYNVRCFAGG